ncbi:MAG: response regulator [Bdellovibrionales bacterium]|nr:response regulator [Bdellovibrionales bacterium]
MNGPVLRNRIAWVVGTVALGVLISWSAELPTKAWLGERWTEMNPLTAVAFLVCAAYLRYSDSKETVAVRLGLPALVVLLGLVRWWGIWGNDLQLDRSLFRSSLDQSRMAPNTAFAFTIFGVGALLSRISWPKKISITELLGLAVFLTGFFTLIGHFYSQSVLSTVGTHIPMAVHTGFCFVLLGIGLFLTRERGPIVQLLTSSRLGGKLARMAFPAVVLVPMTLGWLRVQGERHGYFTSILGTGTFVLCVIIVLAVFATVSAFYLEKADEDAQRKSKILKLILENISDAVVVADPNMKVTHFNSAAEKLVGAGLGAEDLSKWWEKYQVFRQDQVTPYPRGETPLAKAARGIATRDDVMLIRKADGSDDGIFVQSTANPLVLSDGTLVGGVSVLRDITEQVRSEKALIQSKEELEEIVTQRMKELQETEAQVRQLQKMDAVGTLAGGVAHDFNNILGAIQLYCDIIIDNPQAHSSVIETIRNVRQAAQRGAGLTRQLLIFSRKQVYQPKVVDMNDIVGQLLKMLRRMVPENIQIRPLLATGLSSVRVDPGQMEQVILNLVLNAHDAIQGNGATIEPKYGIITIETANVDLDQSFVTKHLKSKPGRHVMLSVTDTGCGMSQEVQGRLFEPFFTTKEVGKGTGLGLSTVYGIIKQSNGTIWVYSEPDRGSVFKVFLPVAEETSAFPEPVSQDGPSFSGTETILVVEDEEELRNLVVAVLKKAGHQVHFAHNAKEALEILKERDSEIHMMITDILMPEMSGVELVRLARQKTPELKVLFMSGYPNAAPDEIVGEVKENVAFIQKPFDTQSLLKKVREILA